MVGVANRLTLPDRLEFFLRVLAVHSAQQHAAARK
jgi:hypothetical protein